MAERIFIGVAWPYANGPLHLGHIAGAYLPADILAQVTSDIFLSLLKKGYIYKASMSQPYCPKCQRFLPDRYVEGTCPYCGFAGARGDQCDACGKPLNASELMDRRCL